MQIGQLTGSGFRLDAALEPLADEFAIRHFVRLERFIAARLLAQWLRQLDAAPFVRRTHDDGTIDLLLNAPDIDCAIEFAMNDAALLRTIHAVARCDRIGSFLANVHRTLPGADHADRWHNDVDGARQVGISVNLSGGAYTGGVLQFADAHSRAMLASAPNPVPGDAVLFEISDALVHRVSPLEAGARTVLAGWFMRSPSEREWRKTLLARLA